MSFVDGFYSFSIDLSDPQRSLYTSVRIKTAKHPLESHTHLAARVLAYAHCYADGLIFSEGMYDLSEPTFYIKDVIGALELWGNVGDLDKKKLTKALREGHGSRFLVYFYEEAQTQRFCHELRGAKTNWVEGIEFYRIAEEHLTRLLPINGFRTNWQMTVLDSKVYLVAGDAELEIDIAPLDIWEQYQKSIDNVVGV